MELTPEELRVETGENISRRPVSRILSRTIIPLGDALLRTLIATYPRVWRTGPARALPLAPQRFPPIWSCSVWGLPCLRPYSRSGALLPHLFTLTSPLRDAAVFSLWHLPSRSLEAPVPDVIRHTALRSSDFPLPAKLCSLPAAIAQPPAIPIVSEDALIFSLLLARFGSDAVFPLVSDCGRVRFRRITFQLLLVLELRCHALSPCAISLCLSFP